MQFEIIFVTHNNLSKIHYLVRILLTILFIILLCGDLCLLTYVENHSDRFVVTNQNDESE